MLGAHITIIKQNDAEHHKHIFKHKISELRKASRVIQDEDLILYR